jgi:undecaprenyl-diphosphatase
VSIERTGNRAARVIVLAALAFALFVAGALVVGARWRALQRVDLRLDDHLNNLVVTHRWLVTASAAVSTALGPATMRIAALVGAVVMWRRGTGRAAIFVVVAVEGTALLSAVAKRIVDRPRPQVPTPVAHASGSSYPSGHAMASFAAIAAALILIVPLVQGARRAAIVGVGALIIVGVGLSRLLLGVHYLSDVLGGWLLGAAWLLATAALVRPHARRF